MKWDKDILSHQDAILLLELIYESLSCTNEETFKEIVKRLSLLIPFDLSLSGLAKIDRQGMKKDYRILNINYPLDWLEIYTKQELYLIDPIIKENFSKFRLQFWADTYIQYDPPSTFLNTAEDFGLKKGYTYGVRNYSVTEGSIFSISGNHIERNQRTELILKLIFPHLHQAMLRIIYKKRYNATLSKREIEILKWIKEGKTNWEIANILKISERTVKFHLENIMQKLNAINRVHALAVAMEYKII